jgi:predicted MFS family arabinose efflux permease
VTRPSSPQPPPTTPPPGHAAPGGAPFPSAGARALRRLGAALGQRDFRLLWIGASVSTIGTWMQRVAQSWVVLTLTGSAFYLGLDQFLGELPILLFTLIGGVIADRHNRRLLLMASQYAQMGCAFALMALVWLDVITIWHILAISFAAGTAQAFGGPAYQSLIPDLVPRDQLPNAIALNSIQFNVARVIGPLVAGVTIAAVGAAACFGLNGLSFLAVIAALSLMRVVHRPRTGGGSLAQELRGGLGYVRDQHALRTLTALAFVSTFLGIPLLTFLPVVAQDVFGGGPGEYSRMMAFSGAGAVLGALVVAWFGRYRHMGLTLLLVQGAFGALIVGFSASRVLWASYLLLFFAGAALIVVFSLLTSLVQLIAPNELRGRVMSIYMVAFRGGSPLGSLLAGSLAARWSVPAVLSVNGVLLVLVSAYFLARDPRLRDL